MWYVDVLFSDVDCFRDDGRKEYRSGPFESRNYAEEFAARFPLGQGRDVTPHKEDEVKRRCLVKVTIVDGENEESEEDS
jgi:hypothetical protein